MVKIPNEYDHILRSYSQETTQSQLKITLSAFSKTFEIWKFESYKSDINETSPDMYHLKTFHIQKNEGVNELVGVRCR